MNVELRLSDDRLASTDAMALGGLYEVSGIHIEPVAMHIGAGIFRGIYVESRQSSCNLDNGDVLSIRLGEEHAKTSGPAKTLIVHRRAPVDRVNLSISDARNLSTSLIDLVTDYYHNVSSEDLENGYLDEEAVAFKLGQFSIIRSKILLHNLVPEVDGSLNIVQ